MTNIPAPPTLAFLCRIIAEVEPVVSLGMVSYGERRYVPIIGGTVAGEGFSGRVMPGGIDWQLQRSDGTLDIAAHYALQTDAQEMIEVRSNGFRHGPAEVMARLARGDAVAHDDYYFRTAISFQTSSARWQHLNSVVAIGRGIRTPAAAIIDVYLV